MAGRSTGAARRRWARAVEPMLVREEASGEPLPEVIISVVELARNAGIGRRLMDELVERADGAGCVALSLSVSERNPAAIHLYEQVGFARRGATQTGLIVMTRPAGGRRS